MQRALDAGDSRAVIVDPEVAGNPSHSAEDDPHIAENDRHRAENEAVLAKEAEYCLFCGDGFTGGASQADVSSRTRHVVATTLQSRT